MAPTLASFVGPPVSVRGAPLGPLRLVHAGVHAAELGYGMPAAQGSTGQAQPRRSRGLLGALAAGAAAAGAAVSRCTGARRGRSQIVRQAGFGPRPPKQVQRDEVRSTEGVGRRIDYVIGEEAGAIARRLEQYGWAQIDGFLGGETGWPDKIRDEMEELFNRGWMTSDSESKTSIGNVELRNDDIDNRFSANLMSNMRVGDSKLESTVETQYEVAPTVVEFVRSLIVTMAKPIGKALGGEMSTDMAFAEINCAVGNGAHWKRKVDNVDGWRTKDGWAPDKRKLTLMYFCNPHYSPEHGGELQLQGVVTPTGAASIKPVHDRLVAFWSDKTVWSVTPVTCTMYREYRHCIAIRMMAKEESMIKYNIKDLTRWFPELEKFDVQPKPRGDGPKMDLF